MKILAIESSCDETAAAVVEDGRRVLSNIVFSQAKRHREFGGVVPEIASRMHIECIDAVVTEALKDANTDIFQVDAVASTCYPGLIGALLVGAGYAKGLCIAASKPFIPVNHIRGHIAAAYTAFEGLTPPFCALAVSGGNTLIVHVKDFTELEVLGGTVDDAAGEAFDKVGRVLGFGYPCGAELDQAAAGGNEEAFSFPVPHTEGPFDFSFSGLKTAALNQLHAMHQRGEEVPVKDFAASFSAHIARMLTYRTLEAAQSRGLDTVVLAGGVAANSYLRRELTQTCKCKGIRLYTPPLSLCGDNAAMIGAQAFYEWQAGHVADLSQNCFANAKL